MLDCGTTKSKFLGRATQNNFEYIKFKFHTEKRYGAHCRLGICNSKKKLKKKIELEKSNSQN